MQPLSPPVFNKIATHSKNLRFFILFVFGFACFQPVVIFVDFQILLHTQLVQNGMKMVPTTDPLGCCLIQFRPTLQKQTQPTTPRTFSFVTLAPKPDFHLHCDQPQHETHNPQHILSEWICCCLGIPFLDRCLRMFFLYSTQGSDKICQDLQRSAKIKQDQPKDRQAQTCKRHLQKQIMKRRAPKMRGRRCHAAWRLQSAPGPWAPEACLTLNLHSLSVIYLLYNFFPRIYPIRRIL